MKVLIAINPTRTQEYAEDLSARPTLSGFEFLAETANPEEIDIIIYEPSSGLRDFSPYTNLKMVQSIWAGVDSIQGNSTLQVPLSRMADIGLVEGMREYVLGHIFHDHLAIEKFRALQKESVWDDSEWLPLARNITVGIVGIGNLGSACATACMALGFKVVGWARTQKELSFPTFHGKDALYEMLPQCDYVVTLLPATDQTHDIINAQFLGAMKNTAMLINPGRGALLDEDALIAALDNGQMRRAVLDVFKTEPMPQNHPFWAREDILLTPHIAAKSRVETASDMIAENLIRLENGDEILNLVDRETGY